MWRMLVVLRKNLQNIGKSTRVADENMYGGRVNGAEYVDRRRHGVNGLSIIYNVVRAPLSIISCLSQPRVNGVDGVWVSGEFSQTSEINHLMVNDSMRYAILM
ncbi:hypothetical protein SLA2020_200260 [Shorea laevis]